MTTPEKSQRLLSFLKAMASIRSKRITAYGDNDHVVYLADIPAEAAACKSSFLRSQGAAAADRCPWLSVKKPRMSGPPKPSDPLTPWVDPAALDSPDKEPGLLSETTILDSNADAEGSRATSVTASLDDHPEISAAWENYLEKHWRPWAVKQREANAVQALYGEIDEMRRKAEESADRFELLIAVGLLQWRDDGSTIERHVLVGPAEISLNASRGELTVEPAGAFETLRLELDMLPPDSPATVDADDQLEDLAADVSAADRVIDLLKTLANQWRADAQVGSEQLEKPRAASTTPRLSYAPAIVLRPRRSTAYTNVLGDLLQSVDDVATDVATPWGQLLAEGATSASEEDDDDRGLQPESATREESGDRYFPLPVNDEQERILDKLRLSPGVLVKGPPGTGKSHTIANLICHLLAKGERVLVTAQAPKALGVLRGLLPESIQQLCVTSLGGDRHEQQILEESVQGILDRKDEWPGPAASDVEIARLESLLASARQELLAVERRLHESRESETSRMTLPGGYDGTAAAIARKLESERDAYGWFPGDDLLLDACPLDDAEIRLVTQAHEAFPAESLEDLGSHLGEKPFPQAQQFTAAVQRLREAQRLAGEGHAHARELTGLSQDALSKIDTVIRSLDGLMARAQRSLGHSAAGILDDAIVGRTERWRKTADKATALLDAATPYCSGLPTAPPQISDGVDRHSLLDDVRRRRRHLDGGGWKGIGLLAPAVMRETRKIPAICRVAGKPCSTKESLGQLEAHLVVDSVVASLGDLLPSFSPQATTLATQLEGWSEKVAELSHLLQGLGALPAGWTDCLPSVLARNLTTEEGRSQIRDAVSTEAMQRKSHEIETQIEQLRALMAREAGTPNAHPCLSALLRAVEDRDTAAYAAAQSHHARLLTHHRQWSAYRKLLWKLDAGCPGLAAMLEKNLHAEGWPARITHLPAAWRWANACRNLGSSLDGLATENLDQKHRRLRDTVETTMEKLVSQKAWRAFFERLNDHTEQHLIAWRAAIRKLGKGTGKYANQHRRTARDHLRHCISAMPAWVMPLHKLWETVTASPGLFDTIIVDEASQAGLDSLVLLLLAKSIIVVGDDMQNSPDDVGVNQMQANQLIREHLDAFSFRDEYRVDSSLFDHANRAFRSQVMLREHFRCVPEIIRFSNTFYGGKLVPLRLVPARDRLPPLKTFYLADGASEGRDGRIRNQAEAEAIVATIEKLIADENYSGKTMGVIALQGRAQAELISRTLATRLQASEIEERRIRCGEPQNFQGDQRDVMFLSMVAAPNQSYAARTTADDQRRYNVAMSRARDQVWLFHSVGLKDLTPADMRHQLLSFFESPSASVLPECDIDRLRQAERGYREPGNQPPPFESWFELDVCLALMERGFYVQPQVEVSSKRIDLVVEGANGRLAVECDGEFWHGPDAFAADAARQRQLERAGWTFERVRESSFYADRQNAIEKIIDACSALDIYPWSQGSDAPQDVRVDDSVAEVDSETEDPDVAQAQPKKHKTGPADNPTVDDDDADGVAENVSEPATETRDDAIPFSGYSDSSAYPDPRDASPTNVRAHVLEIIRRDGPLLRSSVQRLYLRGCPGVSRLGKEIQRVLNRSVGVLLASGEVVLENELGGSTQEGQVLRVANTPRVRPRPVGQRSLEEIPPSELMSWLDDRRSSLGQHFSPDADDCTRYLLHRCGCHTMTLPRRKYLQRVFTRWLQSENQT
jgi:very-short-patch-repair endonuclease